MESNRKQMKFKIGDKVIVTGCEIESRGHTYSIIAVDSTRRIDGDYLYRLKRDDDICGWWWENRIELAPTDPQVIKVKNEYERGLDDAWMLVRQLRNIKLSDLVEIFDKDCTSDVIEKLSASEAIAMWKAWKEKNAIKVGDEVVLNANANHGNEKVIVLAYDGSVRPYNVLMSDGNTEWVKEAAIECKTGRHFNAIEDILNQM